MKVAVVCKFCPEEYKNVVKNAAVSSKSDKETDKYKAFRQLIDEYLSVTRKFAGSGLTAEDPDAMDDGALGKGRDKSTQEVGKGYLKTKIWCKHCYKYGWHTEETCVNKPKSKWCRQSKWESKKGDDGKQGMVIDTKGKTQPYHPYFHHGSARSSSTWPDPEHKVKGASKQGVPKWSQERWCSDSDKHQDS